MRIGCKTGGPGDGVSYRGSHGQTVRVGRSALSTSNFSEMINNVHVFMIKGVNQLLTCAFARQGIQPTVLQL